jgi:tripartite-type tricarboxylate transporter receptor subunit TctC
LAKEAEQRAVLEIFFARLDMAYPFVAPPGVPDDRVRALRDAFNKMMADPAYVAEATKLQFDVTPTTGEQIVDIVKRIYASSPKTIERAIALRNQ